MAKRSSAHSDNPAPAPSSARRSTAPSAEPSEPATATSMRQTRGQSTEPAEARRPNGRKGAKSAVYVPTGQKRGRKPKTAATVPDLDTVGEDTGIDDEAQRAQLEAQLQQHHEELQDEQQGEPHDKSKDEDDIHRASRLSAFSGISGTTAKTSFSQDELAQMNGKVMMRVLPGFAMASDQLAALLVPQTDSPTPDYKEIRRTGSDDNMLYRIALDSLKPYKPHFGSEEYIRPNLIIKALLGDDDESLPSASWRPDSIIYKINLNQMLSTLLVTCNPSDWNDQHTDALARLEGAFPTAIAGDTYRKVDLEFWLNLAAILTIVKLDMHSRAGPNFNPHEVINNTFYDEGTFRHINALHISFLSAPQDALKMVDDLVTALKRPFKSDGTGSTAAIGSLKSQFQWGTFQDHVQRYHANRKVDLDEDMVRAGGIKQILKELSAEIERRRYAELALAEREKIKAKGSRQSLGGKGGTRGVASLIRRKKRISQATASAVQHSTPQADILNDMDEYLHSEDAPLRRLPPSGSQGLEKGQPPAMRPSRSLLDPQPNAQRISTNFDDEQTPPPPSTQPTTVPTLRSVPALMAQATGKRSYMQMEDDQDEDAEIPDPTQDVGFQTDTRDFAAADFRRKELARSTVNARPVQRSAEAGPSNYTSSAVSPSPAKHARLNPGSALPAPLAVPSVDDGELAPSSRYARAKIEAKLNRVTAVHQGPRARIPWSDEEETTLVELIEEHGSEGISYSFLKSIDNQEGQRLLRRTGEDIRFKARNMKTTWLLAGGILPENWEHVVLSKKEIDKVKARGIDYNQEQIRRRAASMEVNE